MVWVVPPFNADNVDTSVPIAETKGIVASEAVAFET
jgi:hypothetical protein